MIDRLAPDYNSRIVLTAENKNMAVSYELWVQLLETALKARRGEDSLYSYGSNGKRWFWMRMGFAIRADSPRQA